MLRLVLVRHCQKRTSGSNDVLDQLVSIDAGLCLAVSVSKGLATSAVVDGDQLLKDILKLKDLGASFDQACMEHALKARGLADLRLLRFDGLATETLSLFHGLLSNPHPAYQLLCEQLLQKLIRALPAKDFCQKFKWFKLI